MDGVSVNLFETWRRGKTLYQVHIYIDILAWECYVCYLNEYESLNLLDAYTNSGHNDGVVSIGLALHKFTVYQA